MKGLSIFGLIVFNLVLTVTALAQNNASTSPNQDSLELANPSVEGMGKSKGIIINYEWQPDFGITSTSPSTIIGNRQGKVRRNKKLDIKAYAPLVNKDHFKMVAGFNYFYEEFNFETAPAYPFYENIEDRNLKTISGQLVMLRPINEKYFYIFRMKGELNGDYSSKEVAVPDYLKTTVEFLYGWKKNQNISYGFGAQLGYALGRRRIYPAFLYNQTFNQKWGIEALLPANADVRYNASEKSLWFAGFSVDGASYNLNVNHPSFSGLETMELRRSEVRGRLRWEREIYDFVWFGLEAGYRHNINFNVFRPEDDDGFRLFTRGDDPIIENKLKGAALFNVELFLVPPRRFLKQ